MKTLYENLIESLKHYGKTIQDIDFIEMENEVCAISKKYLNLQDNKKRRKSKESKIKYSERIYENNFSKIVKTYKEYYDYTVEKFLNENGKLTSDYYLTVKDKENKWQLEIDENKIRGFYEHPYLYENIVEALKKYGKTVKDIESIADDDKKIQFNVSEFLEKSKHRIDYEGYGSKYSLTIRGKDWWLVKWSNGRYGDYTYYSLPQFKEYKKEEDSQIYLTKTIW